MKPNILIIDDEFNNCIKLDKILGNINVKCVFEFKFSPEWYYRKFAGVDAIFINADFPEVDKSNFLRCITSVNCEVPVILIIANKHISFIKKYVEDGIDDFINLPLDEIDLSIIIKRNIYQKRLKVKEKIEIEKDTLIKLLIPLMRALDAKDNYTLEHTQNVAAIAMKIAENLDFNENEKMLLQLSAYFHDIGKIGMPDDILQKTGPLHEEEYNQIKSHPVIGAEIIGEIEELREVAKIIRHHHERYDGRGYPDKLAGKEIPFFSRILTIADIYDALISKRVYKDEINKRVVLQEMKKDSGALFDANLLRVFLNIAEKDADFDKVTDPIFSQGLFHKSICKTDILFD